MVRTAVTGGLIQMNPQQRRVQAAAEEVRRAAVKAGRLLAVRACRGRAVKAVMLSLITAAAVTAVVRTEVKMEAAMVEVIETVTAIGKTEAVKTAAATLLMSK